MLDLAIGRKEIIVLFRAIGMLNQPVLGKDPFQDLADAWRVLLRQRKRYAGMSDLFMRLPNGKPAVNKSDALVWAHGSGRT